MLRSLIMLLACALASVPALFAQSEFKKVTVPLKLAIYQGDAYSDWLTYSYYNIDETIREQQAKLQNKSLSDTEKREKLKKLDELLKARQKSSTKEDKAKSVAVVAIPITFVFQKNNDPELPYTAHSIELGTNGLYEDAFFKMTLDSISLRNFTRQTSFRLSAYITNKHAQPALDVVSLYRFPVVFDFIVDFKDGVYENLQGAFWGINGSLPDGSMPPVFTPRRTYKIGGKTYSCAFFFKRFKEPLLIEIEKAFK